MPDCTTGVTTGVTGSSRRIVPLEEQPVSARLARIREAVESLLNAKRDDFMGFPGWLAI
jgi:hypothetical protein